MIGGCTQHSNYSQVKIEKFQVEGLSFRAQAHRFYLAEERERERDQVVHCYMCSHTYTEIWIQICERIFWPVKSHKDNLISCSEVKYNRTKVLSVMQMFCFFCALLLSKKQLL